MTPHMSFAAACLSLVFTLTILQPAIAQESVRKSPPSKFQAPLTTQKELQVQAEKQEPQHSSEEQMRLTLDRLAIEINSLSAEVQKLRRVSDRSAQTLDLLLNEDRLSKLEDKIQEATDRKSQLDVREQDLQRRMRNIPGELLTRGGIRREEAEAAVKSELQRALDDVHNQQSSYQQRIVEMSTQAERLRLRVDALSKKIEPESKGQNRDQ